jgi:AcrR family transcriptional regulator
MTAKAGIAKGLLFHYFGNKKNLYLYLLQHAITLLAERLAERMKEMRSEDFFERVKELTLIKIRLSLEYPHESLLLMKAVTDPPPATKPEADRLIARVTEEMAGINHRYLFSYLETAPLRPHLPREQALAVIMALFEQLSQKYLRLYQGREKELLLHPEPLLQELDLYCDILKYGIYE